MNLSRRIVKANLSRPGWVGDIHYPETIFAPCQESVLPTNNHFVDKFRLVIDPDHKWAPGVGYIDNPQSTTPICDKGEGLPLSVLGLNRYIHRITRCIHIAHRGWPGRVINIDNSQTPSPICDIRIVAEYIDAKGIAWCIFKTCFQW